MSDHQKTVEAQFGATAGAYLTSMVHSQGEDLKAIGAHLGARKPGRVLDLGCGGGHVTYTAAPLAESVVAYDLSAEMLRTVAEEAARRGLLNISTAQGRAEALPFAAQSFDWVCTRYSAHHWADVRKAMHEVRRVLKPGGSFLLVDVCAPAEVLCDTHLQTIELLRDGSHVRDYSVQEWRGFLHAAGFVIEAEQAWKLDLDFDSWVRRMRTPQVYVEAIRTLLHAAPDEVKGYFAVADDGSFRVDTALFQAR
jgi:ubiquinone/menaquinone biosynthesis C-methylase UbiE